MALLLVLVLFGPAEVIAGKFPHPSEEFLRLYPREIPPLPEPLPAVVDTLCGLIVAGHAGNAELHAALGEALLARDDRALAYRAFRRAHGLRQTDADWGRRMQERMLDCGRRVPDEVVEAEEREGRIWVEALQSYERERIRRGEDPRDRSAFHERYGRAEESLGERVRARRISFAAGVAGVLIGVILLVVSFAYLRRRRRS